MRPASVRQSLSHNSLSKPRCFWYPSFSVFGLLTSTCIARRGMSDSLANGQPGFASQNVELRSLPLPKAHRGRTKEVLPCRVTESKSPAAHPTDRSACPASPLHHAKIRTSTNAASQCCQEAVQTKLPDGLWKSTVSSKTVRGA